MRKFTTHIYTKANYPLRARQNLQSCADDAAHGVPLPVHVAQYIARARAFFVLRSPRTLRIRQHQPPHRVRAHAVFPCRRPVTALHRVVRDDLLFCFSLSLTCAMRSPPLPAHCNRRAAAISPRWRMPEGRAGLPARLCLFVVRRQRPADHAFPVVVPRAARSEEHTSELQSR